MTLERCPPTAPASPCGPASSGWTSPGRCALVSRLHTIGHWIEHLPEPGADPWDALNRYAGADDETAEPALLALVRSRDPRALELVLRRPGAQLLEAAARQFPEAAEQLIPVIRRKLAAGATGNTGSALVGALEPFGAAACQAQRELVDCLKTGRAAIVAARQLGFTDLGRRWLRPAGRSCHYFVLDRDSMGLRAIAEITQRIRTGSR